MKRLILMIQFLTRIPLPFNLNVNEEDFSEGVIYFPVVGLIIGGLSYLLMELLQYRLSEGIVAVMILLFQVFITGGLHLDGLADSFDGLYSNRDKNRMLEIMKDSRVGSNGALALIMLMLVKFILLIEVINSYHVMTIMILTPALARYTVIVASRFSNYAREKGMGNFFIGKTRTEHLVMGSIFVLAMTMLQAQSLIVMATMVVFALLYSKHVTKKLGGMTGDTLGAMIEMSEILALLVFLWR